jgi:hypothetical protein
MNSEPRGFPPFNLMRLALATFVVVGVGCTGEESPGDKQEWSILQGLELTTRSTRTVKAQFEVVGRYEVMGLPREGDGRIVWVMLKPTHGSLYKQMPDGSFRIGRDLRDKLWSERRISNTVFNALRGHLTDPRP